MLGGAMRQSGVFGAAGLYALEHHRERLAEDNANARLIADTLAACSNILLDPATVMTNILVFDLAPGACDAAALVEQARGGHLGRAGGRQGTLTVAACPRSGLAVQLPGSPLAAAPAASSHVSATRSRIASSSAARGKGSGSRRAPSTECTFSTSTATDQ